MKKVYVMFSILLCMSVLFSACMQNEPAPSTHLEATDPTTVDSTNAPVFPTESPTRPTIATPTNPPTEPPVTLPTQPTDPETGLPVYVPGSLGLLDREIYEAPRNRQYRYIYYNMWNDFMNLAMEDETRDFYEWTSIYSEECKDGYDEMILVSYIRYFNIPREEFDKAVEKYIANHTVAQMMTEMYEVPNADIIYTFDNEIINEYYRYE